MKMWMRKALVALFTIATFGLVSPPAALMADKPSEHQNIKQQTGYTAVYENREDSLSDGEQEQKLSFDSYMTGLLNDAEDQSFAKFGDKISQKIEDEYREEVLPKIEDVIVSHLMTLKDDEAYQDLVISKTPTPGKSEKIFHVYNRKTGEDVLRFHVRRDQPPQQGYWFNFHYHSAEDGFQKHHNLGSIYWDRNTPPNWMSH
ncbi:YpjP family protein [Bacillus glycinifermentans]|uniref:YpjP family protein n=1 Tax=Bacillus glycinifermentans TaxID=1664069 RepID=UPI001FF466A2|nr:YpjP family protein [Bacillus glycinifermentans]MEC3609091.1 YpjP family protein [Bacillus glycinifermentans]UOY89510.1 YpjP family protein [Bacillus glycinifermentans]